jgi:hypothetical protein
VAAALLLLPACADRVVTRDEGSHFGGDRYDEDEDEDEEEDEPEEEDEDEDEQEEDDDEWDEPPPDVSLDDSECRLGEFRECEVYDGREGSQECVLNESLNKTEWGHCETGFTPLVLSFDDALVSFRADGVTGFRMMPGVDATTDWPTADTPWLALDRNGNGRIDDGGELFGSATLLATGGRARNGFEALAELDSDADGKITPADAAWPLLLVWSDHDADRTSTPEELSPLADFGVHSIDLGYHVERTCDSRGNCEVERAGFGYTDASGMTWQGFVVDVHLRAKPLG